MCVCAQGENVPLGAINSRVYQQVRVRGDLIPNIQESRSLWRRSKNKIVCKLCASDSVCVCVGEE